VSTVSRLSRVDPLTFDDFMRTTLSLFRERNVKRLTYQEALGTLLYLHRYPQWGAERSRFGHDVVWVR